MLFHAKIWSFHKSSKFYTMTYVNIIPAPFSMSKDILLKSDILDGFFKV